MRFPAHPFEAGRLSDLPLLGEAAWRVLLFLIAHAKDMSVEGEIGRAGVLSISDSKLAAATGVAPRTVRDAVKRLETVGALTADRKNGRAPIYIVHPRWVPRVDSRPLPSRTAEYTDGVGWTVARPGWWAEPDEPRQFTREVGSPAIPEPQQPTAEVHTEPQQPTAEVYRDSGLARAHGHNTNLSRGFSLVEHHENEINNDPPVLGGSGVATPERFHDDERKPDNVTYLPRPVATAPDNNTPNRREAH